MRPDQQAKTTPAYQAYLDYKQGFLNKKNVIPTLTERRKFYRGEQYDSTLDESVPQPVQNICFEYVEKVTAKIIQTPWAVEFTSDGEYDSLHKLDEFYDYQMKQIDDRTLCAEIVKTGLVDGIGCAFTFYDEDTYGNRGKYRGYERRMVVPFEDVFFANPYCEYPQDQQYIGYVARMPVKSVREIMENEGNRKNIELVVPDDFDIDNVGREGYDPTSISFDTCTVVTRYFRGKDGEVCFELATKYAELFKRPHYLNPNRNTEVKLDDETEDYEMGNEKTTVQTPLVKETDTEYRKKLGKFHRYPFAWYRPYPVKGTVLGDTPLTQIMTNQKQLNFTLMMAMLDFQSHGMAKWLVEEDALMNGETINNDPGQIVHVKTKAGKSIQQMVQRVDPSNISAEQINQSAMIASGTRKIYGFDNLTADNNLNDTSGYALQQVQKQQNLVLELPQQRFWSYVRDNAMTDLLFFKFFIDEAKFYVKRSEGEMSLQNNFRAMSQNIANARGETPIGADKNGQLPEPKQRMAMTIKNDEFLGDFEICVEVTQGIAGSQIAESQHYSQVFQWLMSGNVDVSLVKAFIECDPQFSMKERKNLQSALEAVENSQLAQKQAEIDNLKEQFTQLSQAYQQLGQRVDYQSQQLNAYKKATQENAKQNAIITQNAVQIAQQNGNATVNSEGETMSQGEVKSNNALGYEGTSFQ